MSEPPAVVPLPYDEAALVERLGAGWAGDLTTAYRWMLLGRRLDTRMLGLQRQGRVGFYGPATGQEAVSVATALASTPQDWISPGLREQLVALVRGHPLSSYLNHLFANDADAARGRQMPCHPTARDVQYVSMSSVIGTQIGHAVGLAYGLKLRGVPGASFAYFGDGATSANDFHAGLNFAGVFRLPVLFCLTNNQWAISVPVARQSAVGTLAEKADAYAIPHDRIDGTDVVACLAATRTSSAAVRAGDGPRLLEFVLYRMTPHSSSDDPTRYQPAGWLADAEAKDPLRRLEALLEATGTLSADERTRLTAEIDQQLKSAIDTAEAIGPPSRESMLEDVTAPRAS